jgi:cytochrome b involved in lipid metabolism
VALNAQNNANVQPLELSTRQLAELLDNHHSRASGAATTTTSAAATKMASSTRSTGEFCCDSSSSVCACAASAAARRASIAGASVGDASKDEIGHPLRQTSAGSAAAALAEADTGISRTNSNSSSMSSSSSGRGMLLAHTDDAEPTPRLASADERQADDKDRDERRRRRRGERRKAREELAADRRARAVERLDPHDDTNDDETDETDADPERTPTTTATRGSALPAIGAASSPVHRTIDGRRLADSVTVAPQHVALPTLLSAVSPSAAALLVRARGALPTITRDELAQHNARTSCWVSVGSYVYDVTEFLPHHPAGEKTILRYAGRDISEHVPFHSPLMMRLLRRNYLIGRLDDGAGHCVVV